MISPTPYIIAILGNSDSGKDTLAKYLELSLEIYGRFSDSVKFSAPMKDYLEKSWGLHEGALNNKAFRASVVPTVAPDSPIMTWDDLMVRAFKHWRLVHPEIVLYPSFHKIRKGLHQSKNVILTDLRSPQEAQAVLQLAYDYPLALVHIRSAWEVAKASDVHLMENLETLKKFATVSWEMESRNHTNTAYDAKAYAKLLHSIDEPGSRIQQSWLEVCKSHQEESLGVWKSGDSQENLSELY